MNNNQNIQINNTLYNSSTQKYDTTILTIKQILKEYQNGNYFEYKNTDKIYNLNYDIIKMYYPYYYNKINNVCTSIKYGGALVPNNIFLYRTFVRKELKFD